MFLSLSLSWSFFLHNNTVQTEINMYKDYQYTKFSIGPNEDLTLWLPSDYHPHTANNQYSIYRLYYILVAEWVLKWLNLRSEQMQ